MIAWRGHALLRQHSTMNEPHGEHQTGNQIWASNYAHVNEELGPSLLVSMPSPTMQSSLTYV